MGNGPSKQDTLITTNLSIAYPASRLLTILHGDFRFEAAVMMGIIRDEAQANLRPTAHVAEELEF
jgi:hypothetical protein